jgi:HAMP domain-containing protein
MSKLWIFLTDPTAAAAMLLLACVLALLVWLERP